MAHWKLYRAKANKSQIQIPAHAMRLNPSVLAIPFNYEDKPLDKVTDAAVSNRLDPIVISTAGYLALIAEARDSGIALRDLEFSRTLTVDEAHEVNEVLSQVKNGGTLELLRAILTDLIHRRGIIVNKASFWIESPSDTRKGRFDVQNNGIISSTLGEETLVAVDAPLSVVGDLAPMGGRH